MCLAFWVFQERDEEPGARGGDERPLLLLAFNRDEYFDRQVKIYLPVSRGQGLAAAALPSGAHVARSTPALTLTFLQLILTALLLLLCCPVQ